MQDFEMPEFLTGSTPEEIHRRMMNALPEDIDDMPGGFPYDFTYPTALVASQLINFQLARTMMLMYPQYAWGDWLDLHGEQVGVIRREAGKASGKVQITGEIGLEIPKGTIFCTEAANDMPALAYLTEAEAVIEENGAAVVPVTAEAAGKGYNVKANVVTLLFKPLKGVTGVTNPEPITGGTEKEGDASYRERILLEYSSQNTSWVGNDTDFIRWAKEVTGIGGCIVVPAWNGPGTVKLILVDSNGQPANESLVKAVYEHIVSPNDRTKRLLPTACADLTVTSAEVKKIGYACTGLLYDRAITNIEKIKEDFITALKPVYSEAQKEGTLIYNQVRPLITQIPGVEDFDTFTMEGEMENIRIGKEEYPETNEDFLDFS